MFDPEASMQCPFCEHGIAELKYESKSLTHRGKTRMVDAGYYECLECMSQFTTTETDEETLKELRLMP